MILNWKTNRKQIQDIISSLSDKYLASAYKQIVSNKLQELFILKKDKFEFLVTKEIIRDEILKRKKGDSQAA